MNAPSCKGHTMCKTEALFLVFLYSRAIGTLYVLQTLVLLKFSSVQLLSRVRLFATPWIAARQASLSITNSRSSLRFVSIESVMPSIHLFLGRPLLLLPPIPPIIRVFSNESSVRMRWPKYLSFSFSITLEDLKITQWRQQLWLRIMTWSEACGLEPMESDLCLIRKRFSFHLPKKAQTNRQRELDK